MLKYNIIKVTHDYQVEIANTFLYHKDCIEYLTRMIDSEYKGEKEYEYKVYYDSKDRITVYYIGYFGKSLHAKYFIISYEDFTDDEYDDNYH